jgi:hypothetical protein
VTPITETQQAINHVELAEIGACDPAVAAVLWFPLIDDTGVSSGFQSGNLFADLVPKQSYAAMKEKIGAAQGECQSGIYGIRRIWSHTSQVIGAQGIFGGPGTPMGSQPSNKPAGTRGIWTSLTVGEGVTYTATLARVGGRPASSLAGATKAYYKPGLRFTSSKPLAPGMYQIRFVLRAATNPSRTTMLTSRPFKIGGPVKPRPKLKTKLNPRLK